ncbi:MAG: 50S ribosomal protein L5 [Ktedonobacterales bacterium]|nr:50S ribosomal protein L5 [Ktedonobacterales bacterium]
MAITSRLKDRYEREIAPALQKEFGFQNKMQVPGPAKIVINIGMGEAIQNAKAMDNAVRDLADITGQRPVVTKAKRSVAAFKLREGMPIGCMVTLRGQRMYDFLDKLVNVALPRLRDFQGVTPDAFDGRGNYTLGIREQLVFPEVDYDKIDKVRGMEITIVTTARTDEEGRRLLTLIGMPFRQHAAAATGTARGTARGAARGRPRDAATVRRK